MGALSIFFFIRCLITIPQYIFTKKSPKPITLLQTYKFSIKTHILKNGQKGDAKTHKKLKEF